MNFTDLIDIASARVGGKAVCANDEFFAPKENLLKPEKPVWKEHAYTARGKWMDGWETRRRRTPGHDWCVIKLGLRGVVRGVEVDTAYFTGNYPEHFTLDACDAPGASPKRLATDAGLWAEIMPKTPLKGGTQNLFAVRSLRPWSHLRLNIHPDGGVARLRVHGDVVPDWSSMKKAGKAVDLAAVENGGLVLAQSDMYFGKAINMLMPGRAKNMGDGWETKRRRGPGHDWALIRLGHAGTVTKIELDTNHFKGNYPDSFFLEGCYAPAASTATLMEPSAPWLPLLPKAKLKPHKRHFLEIKQDQPLTHLRLSIYPDGGVSRLRVHGKPS